MLQRRMWFSLIMSLFLSFGLVCASDDSDGGGSSADSIDPAELVGDWTGVMSIDGNEVDMAVTFTETTYDVTASMTQNGQTFTVFRAIGSFEMDGNEMIMTEEQNCEIDENTGECTLGDADPNDNIQKAVLEFDGDTLIMTIKEDEGDDTVIELTMSEG